MSKYAIQVENLGKEYIIGGAEQRHDSFREMLASSMTAPLRKLRKLRGTVSDGERFWALRDVNFNVEQGEVLGIIGRNGAGKSTLLKVLSRITSPTTGRVLTYGRMASLLEVGTGFHPELTGRENIYLNGAILGMSKRDIQRYFDEIVAFAEVERFIDTPVKRYSSGMYVRLAFAVAAHLLTDVLLIDEVLAVGDSEFQKKCLGKMNSVANAGRTVLFVSHNMAAVSSLCHSAIFLDRGQIKAVGPTSHIISEYLNVGVSGTSDSVAFEIGGIEKRGGDGRVRIERIEFSQDKRGELTRNLLTGKRTFIKIGYRFISSQPVRQVGFAIAFCNSSGIYVCRLDSTLTEHFIGQVDCDGSVVCEIPRLTLGPGRYTFEAGTSINGQPGDHVTDIGFLNVVDGDFFETGRIPYPTQAMFLMEHSWKPRNTDDSKSN